MKDPRLNELVTRYAQMHDRTVSSVADELLGAISFLRGFVNDVCAEQSETEPLYQFLANTLLSMLPVN